MPTGSPSAKIVSLLEKGTAEEGIAAAVVLGALAPRDSRCAAALARALDRPGNLPLNLAAARALGRIGSPAALKALLPRLRGQGELREEAALALAGCGAGALRAVKKELDRADFATRTLLFRTLARMGKAEGIRTVLEGFLDPSFEVAKAAGRALRTELGSLSPAEREKTVRATLAFLKSAPVRASRQATNSAILYLGALSRPAAIPSLLELTRARHPASTRRHALQALHQVLIEKEVPAGVAATVFAYLDDPDLESVVEPSLAILEPARLSGANERELRRLLGARFLPVRQFAVRRLARSATRNGAEALLAILDGPDAELRRSAARALQHSPRGASLLLPRLLTEKDVDRAWALVHLVKPQRGTLARGEIAKVARAAIRHLDKGDRRAEPLLHLFRHADEAGYSKTFVQRARAAKRSGRYAEAEKNLRLVTRSPGFDADARFLLALVTLKGSGKDAAPGASASRRALDEFRRLAEDPRFDLEAKLKTEARALGPAGYYAVGFALVEGRGPTRALGARILKQRLDSKSKLGKLARAKLRTEGLS